MNVQIFINHERLHCFHPNKYFPTRLDVEGKGVNMGTASSEMIKQANIWPSGVRRKRSVEGDVSRRVKRAHDIDEECNEEIFCRATEYSTESTTTTLGAGDTILGCDDARLALEEAHSTARCMSCKTA